MVRKLGLLGMTALLLTAGPAGAGVNNGKVSLSLGNDVTTAYFFRGILQERNGFITQPYLEVGFNVYENEDAVFSSLTLLGGIWASIHSEKTGASGSGARPLYETDFYAGATAGIGDKLEVGSMYIVYTSPNNAFDAIQEVDFSISLDDSEWLGALALSPSATFAIEFDNAADGDDSGAYAELGIEPGFEVISDDQYPVSLSLPMKVGFSMSDYFQDANGHDDTWGYASFGTFLSVPMAFIPEDFGAWSASLGATLYTFGKNLQKANKDDDPWVVGTFGIGMEY